MVPYLICMRLQKQKAYSYKNKNHYKYVLTIPETIVKRLGWKEGLELKEDTKQSTLLITPEDFSRMLQEDTLYSEFKKSIEQLLKRYPEGLTWTEIKNKLNFSQKVPNNEWVKKLEDDIGLTRVQKNNTPIWKIENNTIFTIGYEGLPLQQFIDILLQNKIEQLIDIREIALSRKNGFSKGILSNYLKEAGIRYQHFSALGSPKSIRHELRENWDYDTFFKEYKKHTEDIDVQEALRDLEGLSKVRKTAIMCYEKDHNTCHRSIISEILSKRWKIKNLRT